MRQIVLDTETTGLEPELNHRIIEIGCVELVNRRTTGRTFHRYLNPEREIDDGALAVHGISRTEPRRAAALRARSPKSCWQFLTGAELVIHNAAFDVAFLDAELARLPGERRQLGRAVPGARHPGAGARACIPGQRNSLDALCKRYSVDNSARELHGALLDARILAGRLPCHDRWPGSAGAGGARTPRHAPPTACAAARPLRMVRRGAGASRRVAEELRAHEAMLAIITKASGGRCLWARASLRGRRAGSPSSLQRIERLKLTGIRR